MSVILSSNNTFSGKLYTNKDTLIGIINGGSKGTNGNLYPNKDTIKGAINYGDRGPKGQDGLTIVSVIAESDGRLTFVYNDGSTFTTEDPLHITQSSDWDEVTNKPFSTIGENLVVVNGALTVDTTNIVEEDNTKPITSAGVQVVVGNINALLETI